MANTDVDILVDNGAGQHGFVKPRGQGHTRLQPVDAADAAVDADRLPDSLRGSHRRHRGGGGRTDALARSAIVRIINEAEA